MVKGCFTVIFLLLSLISRSASILIPMDEIQKNHLKAYGIAYWTLKKDVPVDWLLNYRGGSFLIKYAEQIENECRIRGVSYEVISEGQVNSILTEVSAPEVNMEIVKLETAARIAVYSPNNIFTTKDYTDAVQLALEYAEIPYDIIYDDEVLNGALPKYEWVHLHHEDFTGQFGLSGQRQSQEDIRIQQSIAGRHGYAKVSQMKLTVAKSISKFIAGGGYLFAMCSAGETLDVALSAEGTDIVDSNYDGDGIDPLAQSKLDYSKTLAFGNFILPLNNYRAFSNINTGRYADPENDFFSIFSFSAKWDIVPAMLTQNHEFVIRGFSGQTTAFNESVVKPNVLIMAESKIAGAARYIHGELGKGQWTYYGGHDPEGDAGRWGSRGNRSANPADRKRDLSLTPNSPGYRLILNNVLFPSAKKRKQKT